MCVCALLTIFPNHQMHAVIAVPQKLTFQIKLEGCDGVFVLALNNQTGW